MADHRDAEHRNDENLYDAIVIGGGAAGLSAALILAQAQCHVALIDSGQPRNRFEAHMHGYLSRDGLPPSELVRLGREEVKGAGGELISGLVTRAEAMRQEQAPRFTLHADDGREFRTRRVVVATGLQDELPAVTGLEDYWGGAVFHCPYCHGVEIDDDRIVGVLGCGPESVAKAHLLLQWAERVVLFTNGCVDPDADDLAGLTARGIEVVDGEVSAVEGDGDRLSAAVLADGTRVSAHEMLVAPTTHINRTVLDLLGAQVLDECDDNGIIVPTDDSGLTSVDGVYAAGNVRDTNAQVIDAAAQGLKAAIAVNASLTEERVREAIESAR